MSQECVKVFVRVRPGDKQQSYLIPDLQERQLTVQDGRKSKLFSFDGIFLQATTQEAVFQQTCLSLTREVLHGYNGTVLAYGQTASGKTHTMMGDLKEHKGIIPRAFQAILEMARAERTRDFLIMCSFVQLYNEQLRDLLTKTKLQLRESPENGIFMKDLKKVPITSTEQMVKYLKIGNFNRATGETLMNAESSRSHSIFTIYVQSIEKQHDIKKVIGAKFNLVDLAGSERQSKTNSTGERFIEATKINLSLTALGKVISSLVERKNVFIPYRDSKLTRLLQDSLGGNAKTVMIATVSPSLLHYDETVSTLKYASKAKYITNVPVINIDPKDALLKQYQEEIKRLKIALSQNLAQPILDQLKEENNRLYTTAQKQKKQLINKIKRLQEQFICNPHSQKTNEVQNYQGLQQEVHQMKGMLNQLRRKYKNASKQIFQLEHEHERQKQLLREEKQKNKQELVKANAVLGVLFTEKQLKNILSLGMWENGQFILPKFYFKDRYTLAFPCDENQYKKNQELPMTTATTFHTKQASSIQRRNKIYKKA